MHKKLIQLALTLESEGFTVAAQETLDLVDDAANSEDLILRWETALESIMTSMPEQLPAKLLSNMTEGVRELIVAGKELKNIDPDTIAEAVTQAKKLMSQAGSSTDTLKKFSELGKNPGLTKNASWSAIFRAMPVVGFIFSALLALKNLYYSVKELEALLKEATILGVPPYTALSPDNLNLLTERHSDEPEKLMIVDRLSKHAMMFVDEFISLIANGADFIKDVAFILANAFTLGTSIWLDIGISILFMGLEWAAEDAILPEYKKVLSNLIRTSRSKYREILEASLDYSTL